MKTLLQYPLFGKTIFVMDEFMQSLQHTGQMIIQEYNKVPSQEIWNVENINSTIRQIEYYKETNVFASEEDIQKIYDCLEKSIDFVESQAEAGYKINQPGKGPQQGAPLNIYINDFILGDNTYMPILNGRKIVFLTHSHLNYMNTRDASFAEYTYNHFQNILHKSTLISVVGEKERRRFFNRIRLNIDARKIAVLH